MEARPESEFAKKYRLIEEILDTVLPFIEGMSQEELEQREIERQLYIINSDLGRMTSSEIERVIIEHTYSLPAYEQ